MRVRYRGPSGTGILEFTQDTTKSELLDQLRVSSGINSFTVKYGPPMAMQTISAEEMHGSAKSLSGETLTIVPLEADRKVDEADLGNRIESTYPSYNRDSQKMRPEDVSVAWPEREGTMLLRVMPSDNSCLFTAFGGALPNQISSQQLRRMMADYIKEHPDTYSEAVLGSPLDVYCRQIQSPDRWGGGIELSILASVFDIQISTFDVQTENLINFGETKRDRCILMYSGIHYDRVAFSYSEPPYTSSSLEPDLDRTIWPTSDAEVLVRAQELARELRAAHYYTDTEGLLLRCDVQGCSWIGSGQTEGKKHAEDTGHIALSEIVDIEEDNTLRKCNIKGCSFIGQGSRAVRQHTQDTGHEHFGVILDT